MNRNNTQFFGYGNEDKYVKKISSSLSQYSSQSYIHSQFKLLKLFNLLINIKKIILIF